jgi:hypothetical protein
MLGAALALSVLASDGGVAMFDYATPEAALRKVLESEPLILGVGEYHELKGAPKVPSAVKRFTGLLPALDGAARSLVVETWMLNGRCGKVEKQAAQAVEKTTQRPKETEDEVTTLMGRAYDLGFVNHTLLIDCDDYRSMLDADGELDPDASLKLMRRKVEAMALQIIEKEEAAVPGKMLVLYGGALHNDLAPAAGDEPYVFGPTLQRETKGRYLELDLLVPEYVEKDEALLMLPWFTEALARARKGRHVVVQPSPAVNVILFAFTKPRRR